MIASPIDPGEPPPPVGPALLALAVLVTAITVELVVLRPTFLLPPAPPAVARRN